MPDPPEPIAAEPAETLPPGLHVGPYVLGEVIGAGMFGTVYAARHPVIDKAVAIKVLHRRYAADPDMVARFVDEARAASQVEHSSIVAVFDFGRLPDGRRYTVMERLVGRGLDAVLRARGALPADEALAILRPIAAALGAAHRAGVTHRDVKPGNVFVCAEGPAKLLDFGVAKLLGVPSDAARTATGVAVGTPAYMAPEQCLGRGVGPPADVYALGVLAFRLLAGRLPFEAEASVTMMAAHLNDPPPWLHRVAPGFGPAASRAIRAMMHKDPAQRPRPEAGIEALAAALAAPRRRGPWPALAALALAVAVTLAAMWPRPPPARDAMVPDAVMSDAIVPDAMVDAMPDTMPDAMPDAMPVDALRDAIPVDAAPARRRRAPARRDPHGIDPW